MSLLSDSDVGKQVFDSDENLVGEIVEIDDDEAVIQTDPLADPATLSPFGWENDSEHRLSEDQVDQVSADDVYLAPY